jgi:hypothetical protein
MRLLRHFRLERLMDIGIDRVAVGWAKHVLSMTKGVACPRSCHARSCIHGLSDGGHDALFLFLNGRELLLTSVRPEPPPSRGQVLSKDIVARLLNSFEVTVLRQAQHERFWRSMEVLGRHTAYSMRFFRQKWLERRMDIAIQRVAVMTCLKRSLNRFPILRLIFGYVCASIAIY